MFTKRKVSNVILTVVLVFAMLFGGFVFAKPVLAEENTEDLEISLGKDPEDRDETIFDFSGTIRIIKTDGDTDMPLQNARFAVTGEESGFYGEYLTDAQGEIELVDLVWDSYTVQEIEAPEGYELDSTEHILVIEDLEELVKVIEVQNYELPEEPEVEEPVVYELKVVKQSSEDQTLLEGAKFSLYNEQGELVAEELTTNGEGTVSVANLEEGTYVLVETEAPEGFVLNEEGIVVEVSEKTANEDFVVEVVVENNPVEVPEEPIVPEEPEVEEPEEPVVPEEPEVEIPEEPVVPEEPEVEEVLYSIVVNKLDLDTDEVLEGVIFDLYKDGVIVRENLITDVNGQIVIEGLEEGIYELVETQTLENYVIIDERIEVIVNAETANDNLEVVVTVYNQEIETETSIIIEPEEPIVEEPNIEIVEEPETPVIEEEEPVLPPTGMSSSKLGYYVLALGFVLVAIAKASADVMTTDNIEETEVTVGNKVAKNVVFENIVAINVSEKMVSFMSKLNETFKRYGLALEAWIQRCLLKYEHWCCDRLNFASC